MGHTTKLNFMVQVIESQGKGPNVIGKVKGGHTTKLNFMVQVYRVTGKRTKCYRKGKRWSHHEVKLHGAGV